MTTEPHHTILLVDDEPAILNALRRTLRGSKFRILATSQPEEALMLLDREGIDVLVSDIDMPGMSGLELVSRVRRRFPHVIRILLTGNASMDKALSAINDGEVYRFLTKPWDEAELRSTLAEATSRIDELRRAQVAERRADQRRHMLAELEREHPGISVVVKDDDGYHDIDGERVASLKKVVPDALARLLD